MKLLRLCTQHIRLNHPLPWNVRSEPGQLLLSKGFVLTSQAQIDALMARGMFVDQDEYEQPAHPINLSGYGRNFLTLFSFCGRYFSMMYHPPTSPPVGAEG